MKRMMRGGFDYFISLPFFKIGDEEDEVSFQQSKEKEQGYDKGLGLGLSLLANKCITSEVCVSKIRNGSG